MAGADGTSSASEAAPEAGSRSYGDSCHGSTLAYATCKVGTTVTRAVRLTGPPGCVDCEARGRGRASRSASGGPAPCEAGPGPSPVSGEGSGSGGRARTPAHAELFSSRQAALSPRGDSKCLISGWGGAGRRLTAGIAWRGHRPGRHGGIGRGALGGTPSPPVSSERQLVEQIHLPTGRGARVGMAGTDGDGVAPALPQAARRDSIAKGTKSDARAL